MLYRLRDTKKEKLFERAKKRLAWILMHLLTIRIEGTAEAELENYTLLTFSSFSFLIFQNV
jgi:hypothetical protein